MKLSSTFVLLALPFLAAAHPRPSKTRTITVTASPSATASTCSTGPIQCCDSVQSSKSSDASSLLGFLGIALTGVETDVGLSCSPLSVVGLGGGSCSANAVCCEDNSHGNLISIGCLPITL